MNNQLAIISRSPLLNFPHELFVDQISKLKNLAMRRNIKLINLVFGKWYPQPTLSYPCEHINSISIETAPFAGIVMDGYINPHEVGLIMQLENKGTKILNNPLAHMNCSNKLLCYAQLERNNVPIPKTMGIFISNILYLEKIADEIIANLSLPLVIKKTNWALGFGVIKVESKSSLIDVLGLIAATKLEDPLTSEINFNYVAQQFIPDNLGKTLRVNVLGDKCLTNLYREIEDEDWKVNYASPKISELRPIDEKIEKICLDAARALNITYGGIDLFMLENGDYLLGEINPYPMLKYLNRVYPDNGVLEKIVKHLMPHKFSN